MRPMLAATAKDVKDLKYPLLVSPKLDGVRATIYNGVVMSRSFKPIPNGYVQLMFSKLEGYDGELIVGSPTAKDVYRSTMSGVMSYSGKPEVSFKVFDNVNFAKWNFEQRLETVEVEWRLSHERINSPEELLATEERLVGEGYEGVILRDPKGSYKRGRSTLREQGMVKLKRFVDDEATIVGFEQFKHNANELGINELGYAHRTSHKENQVLIEKLGALVCEWKGKQFKIGTGFTETERWSIWEHRQHLVGQVVKFKYLEVGMKDLPRHPVYLGARDTRDT